MNMLNPVVAMLHNTATDRWHPILFSEFPMPGDIRVGRHKSRGHHTVGFDTRETANVEARQIAEKAGNARLFLDEPYEWDGTGVPALVAFYPVPALNGRPST